MMAVRYPSLARRKQVAKARDKAMSEAVAASEGFVQVPVQTAPRQAPPWPPQAHPGRVEIFDLDHWAHPGRSHAATGPFHVACGICTHTEQHDDWTAAETAQRTHYQAHYLAGETP